jgi:mannose-6-phosphate isomerase-like protein (cupin superfamily)
MAVGRAGEEALIVKRCRWPDLAPNGEGHVLRGHLAGAFLSHGGLAFLKPGERTHRAGCTCANCDGQGRHVHPDDEEVFLILQGEVRIEIEGSTHRLATGDVVVCDPGEDHHLVADRDVPCVVLWLHAADRPPAHQRTPP